MTGRLRRAVEAALLTLLGVVGLTGVALAFTYSPSATHAWSSVAFLESSVPLGGFVRALHHGATNLLVGVGLAYLALLAVTGFPRQAPRGWVARVAAAALVLGLAHLGLLLTADGRAMAAAQELFSIAASVPLAGEWVAAFLRGGPSYGHLTLVHLNALHTLVLPVLLGGMVAWLWRRETVAGGSSVAGGPEPVEGPLLHGGDAAGGITYGIVAVVTVVVALALAAWQPAPLWAPGDPTRPFPARPEWFLLPIFQLRRHLGAAEALATVGVPSLLLVAALLLVRLPQAAARALVVVVAAAFAGLLGWNLRQDGRDAALEKLRADAVREARDARRLAALGLPDGDPLAWDRNDPVVWGRHLFERHCAACHHDADEKPYQGDLLLQGYASRGWLEAMLGHLRSPYFFGNGKIDGMDDLVKGPRRTALVEFLRGQAGAKNVDPALRAEGERLFEDDGCESCHTLDGKGGAGAPDLKGWGSAAWLTAFIRDPGAERFYADQNEMKTFGPDRLDDAELAAIVAYVRSRADEPLNIDLAARVQPGKVEAQESQP